VPLVNPAGRLRRLLRELSGGSGRHYATLVGEQVAATLDGARLVWEGARDVPSLDAAEVRARMGEIEHRGDRARAALIEQLSRSVVTPIDREDLFRLSRSVDDVLDNLRDFAREVDVYEVSSRRFAEPLLGALIEGIEALAEAVAALAGPPEALTEEALAVRKGASAVRRLHQEALGALFEEPVDGEMLKRRELLQRLDVVGMSLGEAADALADGAVKRQQ
jgi:uncharacterized protein Yka (UPF0111/DUF47 family)